MEVQSVISEEQPSTDTDKTQEQSGETGGMRAYSDGEQERIAINTNRKTAAEYEAEDLAERAALEEKVKAADGISEEREENSMILIRARAAISMNHLEYQVFANRKWLIFILGQIITNAVKYKKISFLFLSAECPKRKMCGLRSGIMASAFQRATLDVFLTKDLPVKTAETVQNQQGLDYICAESCVRK